MISVLMLIFVYWFHASLVWNFWNLMFLWVVLQLLKLMMVLNQINVIYVNMCIFECYNTILTCTIEFYAFEIDWGRNQSFNSAQMVKSCFLNSSMSNLAQRGWTSSSERCVAQQDMQSEELWFMRCVPSEIRVCLANACPSSCRSHDEGDNT